MTDRTRQAGVAGVLAAAFVPPSVAGVVGKSFIGHHPVLAVAIWLAYEALVAIAGFIALIADDLLTRWRPPIVDHLDRSLLRQEPRFERRYRQLTLAGLNKIDQNEHISVGDFAPALDAVFVDVTLVPRPADEIPPDVILQQASRQGRRYAIDDLIGCEQPRKLVVIGAPGSGKTTLLQHAARQACQRGLSRRDRRNHVRYLPILLYLRDRADDIARAPDASLPVLLQKTLSSLGLKEPPGWFERKLAAGKCLVLIDGLDEIAQPEDRAKVAEWAKRQIQIYSGNDFVISSRPLGYQSAQVMGTDIVQTCGFTADQVSEFVHSWYRENAEHSLSAEASPGHDPEAHARQKADDLLKILKETPALNDLAVNPLMLRMIASLHWYRRQDSLPLPQTRTSVYAKICAVVLGRRKALPVSAEEKRAILARLAFAMMEQRVSDLARKAIEEAIESALLRVRGGATPAVEPADFLADARADGLLIERDAGGYAFAHKTFQEYLAAVHILENGLVATLTYAVNDDWWAEVALFYAELASADPIVEACLNADTISALALAAECAELAKGLDPSLRARLDSVLDSDQPGDLAASDRRRLAGILLSRHLRHRSRTSAGSLVCVRPIPARIYGLFLADMQGPAPDADPAAVGASAGIATGMRSGDALAFVSWANAIMGGHPACRLPVASEVKDLSEQERVLPLPSGNRPAVWVQADDEATPRLWQVTRRWPQVHDQSQVSLMAAIDDDLAEPVPLLGHFLLLRSGFAPQLASSLLATYEHRLGGTFDADPGRLTDVLALDPDLSRALALDLAPSLARSLRLPLDDKLGSTLGQARMGEIDFFSALAGAREFDLALARAVAQDFSLDPALALETAPATSPAGWQRPVDTLTQPLLKTATGLIFGEAISWAVEQARSWVFDQDRRTTTYAEPSAAKRFATAFASAARATTTFAPPGDPDQMCGTLHRAVTMLEGALGMENRTSRPSSWAHAVAERLAENAMPVFSRAERPTRGKSTAIRLAALCLAAEADELGQSDIGDLFRDIAVGITWLQKRTSGELPATEVILLAVDDSATGMSRPARERLPSAPGRNSGLSGDQVAQDGGQVRRDDRLGGGLQLG